MYIYEQDPGHGWLGVPLLELVKLRIADKISTYSYHQRAGNVIWLEEDCDMTTYLLARARQELGTDDRDQLEDWICNVFLERMVNERHVNQTRIRNMPAYDYEALRRVALAELGETV